MNIFILPLTPGRTISQLERIIRENGHTPSFEPQESEYTIGHYDASDWGDIPHNKRILLIPEGYFGELPSVAAVFYQGTTMSASLQGYSNGGAMYLEDFLLRPAETATT